MLAAADELAQTGECDPKEIYNEAQELEERMSSFLAALARRRSSLDMTVSFYSHVHAVSLNFLILFSIIIGHLMLLDFTFDIISKGYVTKVVRAPVVF